MILITKSCPEARVKINIRSLNWKRILNALLAINIATERANDDKYSKSYVFEFVSHHFQEDKYNLCTRKVDGKMDLFDSIPAHLAHALTNKGCKFTSTNRHTDCTYVSLPNVAPSNFKAYREDLENRATQAAMTAGAINLPKMGFRQTKFHFQGWQKQEACGASSRANSFNC